jgi:TonB family protein
MRAICFASVLTFWCAATANVHAQSATPSPDTSTSAPGPTTTATPSSSSATNPTAEVGTRDNPMVVVESVAAQLKKRMAVNYPREAVDAKVSGRVKIQLFVGKNGAVLATRVVEGAEPLRSAAQTSMARAEFSPMIVNGQPVYMATTMRLVFTLDEKTTPATPKVGELIAQEGQAADADALRAEQPFTVIARAPGSSVRTPAKDVSFNVSTAKLIHSERPDYPDSLKRAGVQGTVVLRGIIRKDGTVDDLAYVSGPKMLAPSAIEAVKRWRYAPTLLGDEPVEVDTKISVVFQLGNAPLP